MQQLVPHVLLTISRKRWSDTFNPFLFILSKTKKAKIIMCWCNTTLFKVIMWSHTRCCQLAVEFIIIIISKTEHYLADVNRKDWLVSQTLLVKSFQTHQLLRLTEFWPKFRQDDDSFTCSVLSLNLISSLHSLLSLQHLSSSAATHRHC